VKGLPSALCEFFVKLLSSATKGTHLTKDKTQRSALRKKHLALLAVVPLLATCIFSLAAFRYGSPGFRVDKTQHGLYISKVLIDQNPVQPGDLIVAVNGMPYTKVLGLFLLNAPSGQGSTTSVTLLRDRRTFNFTPAFTSITWAVYLAVAWPHLLLIFLFLFLGAIALFRADPGQPAALFYFMLCWFATTVATTLPSHFGLLQPKIISLSFLGITISNWLAFGALAHFICRFPRERDLCRSRPWLASILYLVPPFIALGLALSTAGLTTAFFSALQRFRNLFVPAVITGSFLKHAIDLRHLRSPSAKNQVKLSLTAYWLTFAPYLTLYLLPNLIFDRPLISFRIVLLAATVLPAAYLIALLRYRLLGIDRLISRTIAYFIVVFLLTMAYTALLALLKRWFFGRQIFSEEIFLIFLLAIALGFTPLINRTQILIDRYFFRYRPDDNALLFDFSQKLASTLRLSELITLITNELPQQIQVTASALLLLEEIYSTLYSEHLRFGDHPWPASRLVKQFRNGEQALFCHEEHTDQQLNVELSELDAAGFVLALPLRVGVLPSGVLLLGPRKDGRLFREDDIRLLATLANQAALALKNSLHYTSLVKSKKQLEILFSKVAQTEKMAALGEVSATLAHEIKNPLGIIRSSAQYLAAEKRPAEIHQEMLHYIIDEVDGLNTVITNILGLAKFKNPIFNPIDLQQRISKLCSQWQGLDNHNQNIRIRCTIARRLPLLYADFQQLRQVLFNLLRNSEEALGDGGNITLSVEKEKEFVLFRLQDDGPGIAEAHSGDLFKKFFTTKKDGLGLGLSVCEQIVAAHHGSIILHNQPTGGVEAVIRLPFQPLATLDQENNHEAERTHA